MPACVCVCPPLFFFGFLPSVHQSIKVVERGRKGSNFIPIRPLRMQVSFLHAPYSK